MSKLLINEGPLQVLPTLAERIGLNQAIVLQQIHYWIRTSKGMDTDEYYRDGRWWTDRSMKMWQEMFPFWTKRTIQNILARLIDEDGLNLVERKQFGDQRTPFSYTINYDQLEDYEEEVEESNEEGGEKSSPPQGGGGERTSPGGVKNFHPPGGEKSSPHTSYKNRKTSEGEDDARAPARERSPSSSGKGQSKNDSFLQGEADHLDLSFLADDDRQLYRSSIEELARKNLVAEDSAEGTDAMWNRLIQKRPVPRSWLREMVKEHGSVRLLAAMYITNQSADNPNQKYLHSVLKGLEKQQHQNTRRGGYEEEKPWYVIHPWDVRDLAKEWDMDPGELINRAHSNEDRCQIKEKYRPKLKEKIETDREFREEMLEV